MKVQLSTIVLGAALFLLPEYGDAQQMQQTQQAQVAPRSGNGTGSATFTIPEGATGYTYEVWDEDVFSDDLLNCGEGSIPGGSGGAPMNVPFGTSCEDGDVTGPKGGSGEGTAEVYVKVTFQFPGGATETQTSEPKSTSCN